MRTNNYNTLLRNTLLATVALVAAGFIATTHAGSTETNYLTFNRDVALPGVVLPAGTYVFEIANPETSHDIVRVRTKDGRVHYMGFTLKVDRPAGLAANQPVSFREARPDLPVPIAAWFPLDSSSGRQFLYR